MLDVLSVLPTDLAYLYFGIDCHEQVRNWLNKLKCLIYFLK